MADRAGVGREPIIVRVIAMQLFQGGRRIETDQPAFAATHHGEKFGRSLVQPVRGREHWRQARAAAYQTDAHATSFQLNRWLRISRRTSTGRSRRMRATSARFRSIFGI